MAGAEIQGRLNWRIATVVALHDETATARTITFEVSDWLDHLPGQRVDIRVTATDGYSAVRQYSIASAPRGNGLVDLSVQRLPDGEVSPYLTQEVVVGDRLELRGPIGEWFVWHDDQTEPIQLIAGGSGVVPLMAMIRSRAAKRSSAPFRLLYSVRNPDSVWYGEELQALSSGDHSIGVTYLYTRSVPPDWPRRPGRIDPAVIGEATWSSKLSPTCYICGPTTFVDHAAELLMASGHPAERIRTERFGPTGDHHDLTSGERA